MKTAFILFFILLFLGLDASAFPPVGVSGQDQSNKYPAVLKLPNSQVTDLGSASVLLETGNTNILLNPSFEHSTYSTSWSLAGTGTYSAEPTIVIQGKKSLKIVLSASAPVVTQSSTRYAAQFADGVQGLAMVRVKSDIALSVCSIQAGTTSTTNCVTTSNNNLWGLYKIPFILGATSNGISIASASSQTGTVYVDDTFVGAADLKTDSVQIQTQTTKFTAGSTAINTTFTGTPTTVGAGNFTISSGVMTALRDINVSITCSASNSTTATVQPNILVNGVTTGHAQYTNPLTGYYVALSWSGIIPAGQTLECRNSSSTATNGQVSVLATNTTNTQIYSASCGANCVDTFSAKVSSAGVVSGENIDWINGNASVTSTSLYTLTWNTGIFTVAPNCVAIAQSSTVFSKMKEFQPSSSTTGSFFTDVADAASAQPFTLVCQKQGADFTASRTIVGSFNEVMTTPNVSKPKTCYYSFGGASATLAAPTECTTGTCVEVYDSCGTGTPPTWATTALYQNLTFAAGTFANSTPLDCDCKSYDVTATEVRKCEVYFDTGDQTWSSNASGGAVLNLYGANNAGTGNTGYVSIECEGQAP